MAPAQRRAQIMDVAHRLFVTRGFQATTIEDILAGVGIAKGTLYYHFAGKEQILEAIIMHTVADVAERAAAVVASNAPPVQKLLGVLGCAQVDGASAELVEQFHAPGNAEFHLMSNVELVRRLVPLLTIVVEEGVAQGVFTTSQPREDVEIILTAGFMLTDAGIFTGEVAEIPRRTMGVVHAAERLLGCPPGALVDIARPPQS